MAKDRVERDEEDLVRLYLTDIGQYMLLTKDDEVRLAKQIEQVLKTVPGTSSAYAERALGGYYLDVTPDRAALARYGIMVQDVQDVIATALGGQTVTVWAQASGFAVNVTGPGTPYSAGCGPAGSPSSQCFTM